MAALARHAHGLPDDHEAARQDAQSGRAPGHLDQMLADAARDVGLAGTQRLHHLHGRGHANERRLLQLAREEQVVRAALADHHRRACAVDVLVDRAWRIVAHQPGAFDQDVGIGERDLGAALRIDRKEADVGRAAGDGIDRLRRRREFEGFQRHAQAVGQGLRQIDRHAARAPGGGVGAGEDRIAEVDRGAQAARRGEQGGGGGVGREGGAHRGILQEAAFRAPGRLPGATSGGPMLAY